MAHTAQEEAIRRVGEAFSEDATNLTPQQRAAFERVRAAFSPPDATGAPTGREITILDDTQARDRKREFDRIVDDQVRADTTRNERIQAEKERKQDVELPTVTIANPDTGQTETTSDRHRASRLVNKEGFEVIEGDGSLIEGKSDVERLREEEDNLISEMRNLTLTPRQESFIQSIQNQYAARRAQLEDINERLTESQRALGIRLGTERFAPTIAAGLVSERESRGIARLRELDAEEKRLILQAELAFEKDNFERFNTMLNEIQERRIERQEQLQTLQEEVLKQNKAIREKEQEFIQVTKIQNAFQAGNTTVQELNAALNFDEEGNPLPESERIPFDTITNIHSEFTLPEEPKTEAEALSTDLGVTTRDIARGLTNAGMTIEEFSALSPTEQRSFIFNTGGDSDDVPSVNIPTFDDFVKEFIETEQGQELVNRIQETGEPGGGPMTFRPEVLIEKLKNTDFLRDLYNDTVEQVSGLTTLSNLTPTNKRDIQQAGLGAAESRTKRFFLSTPSSFKKFFKRQVALGSVNPNATFDEVSTAFNEWEQQKEAEATEDAVRLCTFLFPNDSEARQACIGDQ